MSEPVENKVIPCSFTLPLSFAKPLCRAQFAEIMSFGVHLSMCFTLRKQRAYIPCRNAPESFSLHCGA